MTRLCSPSDGSIHARLWRTSVFDSGRDGVLYFHLHRCSNGIDGFKAKRQRRVASFIVLCTSFLFESIAEPLLGFSFSMYSEAKLVF
jgi:hypothetical protein